jgi:hypothetical protein
MSAIRLLLMELEYISDTVITQVLKYTVVLITLIVWKISDNVLIVEHRKY